MRRLRMERWWVLLMGAAQLAHADSAVVAVGQCDAASGIAARSFRTALQQKMGTAVQSEVDTARPFGGLSDKSVPQINGAVASARSDFYSDKPNDAVRTLQGALDDCTRIAPSDARWGAEREVLTLLAQVQLKSNPTSAEATLMRIFRVEPDYRPDNSLFPPSFQRFTDTVRKANKKRAMVRFEVTTSPPGKPVYVGGKRVGVGPVKLKVPAGDYRVEADWGHRGETRVVTVPSPPIELSASVEGAVYPDDGPCLAATQDVAAVLVRFAPVVGASRLYGVHIDAAGDSNIAVLTSVDVSGNSLREVQVRLQSGAPSTEALGLLAGYSATGTLAASVEVTQPPPPIGAPRGVPLAATTAGVGAVVTDVPVTTSPTPAVEHAYDPHRTRFEAAVRLGVAFGLGNADATSAMSDLIPFSVPVGVDVGVRLGGVFFLGGYFQYAFLGSPSSSVCQSQGVPLNCSSSSVSVGGELLIHPLGSARVDPWFGVGSGFEWLNISESANGISATETESGWQFFNVQVGIDFAIGSLVRLGPYAGFAMGEYTKIAAGGTTNDVTNTTVHEWVSVGVRLVLLP